MKITKFRSAALAAASIAVALSVGFAVPASAMAYYIASSAPTVSRGETIVISSNGDPLALSSILVNGEVIGTSPLGLVVTDAATWESFSPCVTIDVTFRMYNVPFEETIPVSANDSFVTELNVEWIGDNTVDCDDTWGAGESADELAPTGSDASTVAGLTGVAGVATLAVAVAVARRSRRAQR
jgi:hypothetical protein